MECKNLKYMKPVRYYFQKRHDIKSVGDFDFLIYLYHENTFSEKTFKRFQKMLTWDKRRMNRFIEQGWIVKVDMVTRDAKNHYAVTPKLRNMMNAFYGYLNGDFTIISQNPRYNPIMRSDASYHERRHANFIRWLSNHSLEAKQQGRQKKK